MGDGRNDEPSIVLEADEATVKEVVYTRGQEEPVLAIQSLLIRGITPGLAMARDEMNRVLNPGYPAPRFDFAHTILEDALPVPRPDDCQPIGFGHGGVIKQLPPYTDKEIVFSLSVLED